MARVTIERCKCKRCGHGWFPRVRVVTWCPKCHSALWDKSPTAFTKAQTDAVKVLGEISGGQVEGEP